MKKRGPSTLMVLLSALGLMFVVGLILYFFGKFVVEKVDSIVLFIGIGLMFAIALLYELRGGFKKNGHRTDFLRIATGIRPHFKNEIVSFFNSSKGNGKPIELFQKFMVENDQVINIDWSGEENEGEIEAFIQSITQQKISWNSVKNLRLRQKTRLDSSDTFLKKLLRDIDEDLKQVNCRLLLLKTDGDCYSVTVVDKETFGQVLTYLKKDFYSVERLMQEI